MATAAIVKHTADREERQHSARRAAALMTHNRCRSAQEYGQPHRVLSSDGV